MRVLITFNHPAPYKVKSFNELSELVDLTVLFERTKERDRPLSYYEENNYKFKAIFLKDGYIGHEGSISNGVRTYIKEHHKDFDLILMNGYSHLAEIKAIKYMHSKNIKFGLMINGGVIKKETFLKRIYKTSLVKKASYYLSPNTSSDRYLEYYGADKKTISRYIYSNLDESEILDSPVNDKTELRKKYNLPLDKKIFINPCQFIKRKNNIELISLFKNRKEVLLLVGSGVELENYNKFINENKMDNVIILPFKNKKELFELYQVSDCHITLSKQDIFGHTVLEAFANGLPVISSDKVVSSLEYIKNGENGYVVSLEKKDEIKSAIENVNAEMGKNAINTARNLTFKNVAKSIYNVLEKL